MIYSEDDLQSPSGAHEVRMSRKNVSQKRGASSTTVKVRLNLVLRGDVARILIELRSRGITRSYADCINQSIQLFYSTVMKQDLLLARLKALERGCDDGDFREEE
jgi:hypothetical protein